MDRRHPISRNKKTLDLVKAREAAAKLDALLRTIDTSDIIEGNDELLDKEMKKNLKESFIRKHHPYAITQLEGKYYNGYWQTYSPDGKKIRRATRQDLIDYLMELYSKDAMTLEMLFPEWLEWKCNRRNNKNDTRKHHIQHFEKYVSGTKLGSMPLTKITLYDCEDWAIEVLRKKPMTAKIFNTIKIVVTGPLSYAVRLKYIPFSPWLKDSMDYSRYLKKERNRPAGETTFSREEREQLEDALLRDYAVYRNSVNLGIAMNFDLGLRTGELAALKWSDISDQDGLKSIFIQRQEDSNTEIEEAVKSDARAGYRELPLSDNCLNYLEIIKRDQIPESEWIFTDKKGNRRKKHAFMDKIREIQKREFGVKKAKTVKNIRMTFCSELCDDMGAAEARVWLGHENISTTQKYYIKSVKKDRDRRTFLQNTQTHPNLALLK